jgi:hypothetical protein
MRLVHKSKEKNVPTILAIARTSLSHRERLPTLIPLRHNVQVGQVLHPRSRVLSDTSKETFREVSKLDGNLVINGIFKIVKEMGE